MLSLGSLKPENLLLLPSTAAVRLLDFEPVAEHNLAAVLRGLTEWPDSIELLASERSKRDWLEAFAALADDAIVLASLHGVLAVTVQACSEAGITPPLHVLLWAVILLAVADVRAINRRIN